MVFIPELAFQTVVKLSNRLLKGFPSQNEPLRNAIAYQMVIHNNTLESLGATAGDYLRERSTRGAGSLRNQPIGNKDAMRCDSLQAEPSIDGRRVASKLQLEDNGEMICLNESVQ